MIEIIKISTEHANDVANLYNKIWGPNYPLKEFLDPISISKIIKTDQYIWYIAVDENKVVGSKLFSAINDDIIVTVTETPAEIMKKL